MIKEMEKIVASLFVVVAVAFLAERIQQPALHFLVILIGAVGIIFFLTRKPQCPKCGRHSLVKLSRVKGNLMNRGVMDDYWECQRCGYRDDVYANYRESRDDS